MQDLPTCLKNLKNKKENYQYQRLYRILYKEEYYKQLRFNPDEALIDSLKTENFKVGDKGTKAVRALLTRVLETVLSYEAYSFSHPQQALCRIKEFSDYDLLVILDLKTVYEKINRQVLDKQLRKKIQDERFIRLINKFINAGLFKFSDSNSYSRTLSASPLAEILVDEYLKPLDRKLVELTKNSARYHNQIILGLKAKDLDEILNIIKSFILNTYKIKISEPVAKRKEQQNHFLEYEISVKENKVYFRIPQGKIEAFILQKGMVADINHKPWKSSHRGYLINRADIEILKTYNRELKGFYRYYALAGNVSRKCSQLKHIAETSCLKTLSRKHRTRMSVIKERYKIDGSWGIEGELFFKGFTRTKKPLSYFDIDRLK